MATSSVRRSVVLPRELVEDAQQAAPLEFRDNFNGLVREALTEYIARRREREFERAMADMAADPDLAVESRAITQDFRFAEGDGLS